MAGPPAPGSAMVPGLCLTTSLLIMERGGDTAAGALARVSSSSSSLQLLISYNAMLGVYLFGGGIWADHGVLARHDGGVQHGFDLKNDTK